MVTVCGYSEEGDIDAEAGESAEQRMRGKSTVHLNKKGGKMKSSQEWYEEVKDFCKIIDSDAEKF